MQNEFNQPIGNTLIDWCSPAIPSQQTMLGHYCTLERLNPDKHAPKLYDSFLLDSSGWTYLWYGPYHTYEDFYQWIVLMHDTKDVVFYVILDNKSQQPIGHSGYLRIVPKDGVLEIGHLHFSKPLRKTPAATEVLFLMMSYAFDDLGYRRCEWKCDVLNQPSQNAAKRFGFKFEGIFRQHIVYKNRNRDTAWFSVIDSEWPALKMRFQKWLHPSNFDQTGQQRLKLNDIK